MSEAANDAGPQYGEAAPYPYEGPAEFHGAVLRALSNVVDPEVALSIVDLGLVYGVSLEAGRATVRMTMTSAACPASDVIADDVVNELEHVLPADCVVEVVLCWEPFWTPDRMSPNARRFMGG